MTGCLMSEATAQAVEDALRSHFQDEAPGSLLSAWSVVAATVGGGDSDGSLSFLSPDAQPQYVTLGLMDAARITTKAVVYAEQVAEELGGA